MPKVNFGSSDEAPFELVESNDLIGIRTRSRRSVMGVGPVNTPEAAELSDGELVASFPEAGVEVFRVEPESRSVDDRKRALRGASDVQFAGSVLVRKGSNEPVLYTENVYVRFQPEIDPDDCELMIREAGLTVRQQLEFAPNAFSATAPEGTGQAVFDIANQLLARPEVMHCHPELIQRRVAKQIFAEQWHLDATTVGGVAVNAHANVEAAHAITRGSGVTIAVVDDGVDIDHPEFASTGKIVAARDVTSASSDPRPRRWSDNHGTPCAGVACADGNHGASGVAPRSRLMPIRLMAGLGSFHEAEAFRWAADNGADIISCSWGPPDGRWWDTTTDSGTFPLPASTRAAIDYAVTNGRGGKGCVIFFAAGNGNESVDKDGYASYDKVIAVAACNDRGTRSVYSDFGKAVWCAFPSNDFGHAPLNHPPALTPGIWATDRRGNAGYNPGNGMHGDAAGDYTNSFGGTSSSCPGAAGVAALVLSANAQLRWDEVKEIFRQASDRIDPANGQYDSQGHSTHYGYGRLNAEAAVKLAKRNVGRLLILRALLNVPIPDLGRVEGTIDVAEAEPVEKFTISVRLEHSWIGDLVVTAVPPAATGVGPIVLHNRAGGRRKQIDMNYESSNTPALAALDGQSCQGTWTIRVEDKAAQDSGTLIQIGLQLSLPPADAAGHADAQPRVVSPPPTGTARKKTNGRRKKAS